jgi:hypothetical protein
MDIKRGLKDVILITPWIIAVLCMLVMTIPVYLLLLFWSNLIFICEKVGGKICQIKQN